MIKPAYAVKPTAQGRVEMAPVIPPASRGGPANAADEAREIELLRRKGSAGFSNRQLPDLGTDHLGVYKHGAGTGNRIAFGMGSFTRRAGCRYIRGVPRATTVQYQHNASEGRAANIWRLAGEPLKNRCGGTAVRGRPGRDW